jgi:hypothetical protein
MAKGPLSIAGHSVLLLLWCASGCTYTVADQTLPDLDVAPAALQPRIEYTVDNFAFAKGNSDLKPYGLEGRLLAQEIATSWHERGYIEEPKFVDAATFSGSAEYNLTLNGTLRAETSFWMQVLNALTLMLAPYTVTQHYDVQYVLEDVRSGEIYGARIQATEKTWVDLLLVLALPFAQRGHRATVERLGEHLYEELQSQGAFRALCEAPTDGIRLTRPH